MRYLAGSAGRLSFVLVLVDRLLARVLTHSLTHSLFCFCSLSVPSRSCSHASSLRSHRVIVSRSCRVVSFVIHTNRPRSEDEFFLVSFGSFLSSRQHNSDNLDLDLPATTTSKTYKEYAALLSAYVKYILCTVRTLCTIHMYAEQDVRVRKISNTL
jgi:hypothetical protein